MADKVTVKVLGLEAAFQQLQKYSQEVREKCKEAVKEHTEAIKAEAVQAVPVDTGRLKGSIQTEITPAGYFGRVKAKTPYAHIVELGSVDHTAKPFLNPAYEAHKNKFAEDIKQIIKDS